ncbi:MAG: DUF6734 family protein [Bacteroidota bacterium]
MRIVQTFWTGQDNPDPEVLVTQSGGWLSAEYHWMSWAFSCLQLRQFYSEVELYTDEAGKRLLMDILELPYTKVHVTHKDMPAVPNGAWAMAKVFTYSLQEQPFLHADGDVYIWKPFPETLLDASLIAQNKEVKFPFYDRILANIYTHFERIPDIVKQFLDETKKMYAYNAGILGGNDLEAIKNYTNASFELLAQNEQTWYAIEPGDLNFIAEQFIFTCVAKSTDTAVGTLLAPMQWENNYKSTAMLDQAPFGISYAHIISNFKKEPYICDHLSRHLLVYYPEMHAKVLSEMKRLGYSKFLNKSFQKTDGGFSLPKGFAKQVYFAENAVNHARLKGDFLQFTQGVEEAVGKLPDLAQWHQQEEQRYRLHQSFMSANTDAQNAYGFKLAPYCALLESQWRWVKRKRVDFAQLCEKNLEDEEGPYLYLVAPDASRAEVLISIQKDLRIVVLNHILNQDSVSDIFEALPQYFDEEDLKENATALREMVIDIIDDLILSGVIIAA